MDPEEVVWVGHDLPHEAVGDENDARRVQGVATIYRWPKPLKEDIFPLARNITHKTMNASEAGVALTEG